MSSLVLTPTERIVWRGDRQHTVWSHALAFVTVVSCLAAGAAFSTTTADIVYKAIFAVACLLIVVSSISHMSQLPKTFVLTNRRIVELDRDGQCLRRDGSPFARKQEATIRRGLCGWTVTINTCQMDHGDPETVQVGPLYRKDAMELAKLLPTVALEAQAW